MNNGLFKYRKELLLVVLLAIYYIVIRSLNFPVVFNFSSEQASFATKALELFRSHKIELIGPPISWRYEGRYFFQGSLTYYAMMAFLLLGHWDPLVSTYLMVPFGAIMMIILYLGARMLLGRKKAYVLAFLFASLPFYINYSRFFWNPTLQLLFAPLTILFMGLHKKYGHTIYLFLISFSSGLLLLFHYQYLLVIVVLALFYLFFQKTNIVQKAVFLLGFPLGFSPWIVFELRNHFYNLKTILLFLQHADKVFPKGGTGIVGILTSYYMLSPLLFILILLLNKITLSAKIVRLAAIIVMWDLFLYIPAPKQAFGMARDWNYMLEKKVYDIIRSQHMENFNVVNLGYDTVAAVQKYFLIRDRVKGNWEEYYHNRYLFLITNGQDYMENPAYEINTFSPNKVIRTWVLNGSYKMLLLERVL